MQDIFFIFFVVLFCVHVRFPRFAVAAEIAERQILFRQLSVPPPFFFIRVLLCKKCRSYADIFAAQTFAIEIFFDKTIDISICCKGVEIFLKKKLANRPRKYILHHLIKDLRL